MKIKNKTIIIFLLLIFVLSICNPVIGAQEPEPDWNKIVGYGVPADEDMKTYGEPVEVSDIDIIGYGAGEVHTLTKEQWKEAWGRVINYKNSHGGVWPNYVDVSKYHVGVDKIYKEKYNDMDTRWKQWKKEHNGQEPNIIGIEGPVNGGGGNTPSNAGPIQKKLMDAVGTFTSFTEFYNLCKRRGGYEGYYNDKYTLEQEITRFQKRQTLNCVDVSQLGYALAKEMGYQVKYQRTVCITRSGKKIGHILLKVKGGTDLPNWTTADLAASLRDGKPMGQNWGSAPWEVNENWLNTDDGKT